EIGGADRLPARARRDQQVRQVPLPRVEGIPERPAALLVGRVDRGPGRDQLAEDRDGLLPQDILPGRRRSSRRSGFPARLSRRAGLDSPTAWYVAFIEREIISPSHPDYPAGFGTSLLPTPEVSAWPACPDDPRAVPGAPRRSPSPRDPSIPGSSRSAPSTSASSPSIAPRPAPNGCSPISMAT